MLRGPSPLIAPPSAPAMMSIIADTPFDMRQYSIEGPSGLCNVGPPEHRPTFHSSVKTLTWPNGCKALLFSAEDPETLRGASGSFFWWDELAKAKYAREGWDNMLFGMREGNPRGIVTTTPKPIPLLKDLLARRSTYVTKGSTFDNRENLSEIFYREVIEPKVGTRLGRQEIEAEILEDVEGALWTREMIERCRVMGRLPPMARVVIGVDPAVSSGGTSALTGIVAMGLAEDGKGYVLFDRSGRYSPGEWSRVVVQLMDETRADRIIAEGNQGGEMVRYTLSTVRPNLPIKIVHASVSKKARAEPIAALSEQDRIIFAGTFPELEDQLCTFAPLESEPSPDRLDAFVWAATALFPSHAPMKTIGVRPPALTIYGR